VAEKPKLVSVVDTQRLPVLPAIAIDCLQQALMLDRKTAAGRFGGSP